MKIEAGEKSFLFIGNQLCLDFINTEIIRSGQRVSLIDSYDDFRAWLLEANVVEASSLARMEASCGREEAEQIVLQALELRTTLRSMVEQITTGHAVSAWIIDVINGWLEKRRGYQRLVRTEDGYATTVCYEEHPGGLLASIAESAADLLVHADLRLVRKCENSHCILYFYDTSKNHARRWCSMDICGNRTKVAVHYRRTHRAATENAQGS